jgi:hypothetical protein
MLNLGFKEITAAVAEWKQVTRAIPLMDSNHDVFALLPLFALVLRDDIGLFLSLAFNSFHQ